ncbi:MAG: GTP-binding protein, partial [Huintestinicola sp.]
MKRIVIGMTAHVDAGKTTLSEAMLYVSGELRKLGRVDKGDSFLDTHAIERSRGITVFAKQAVMRLEDGEYTLLDTPGHTDFSAETERALSVLDCAVLVISGIDGVQSHTETIWRLLGRYNIPVFIFVNKMDITPLDRDFLLRELKAKLSDRITDFTPREDKSPFFESLADLDEDMMNSFLETGEISGQLIGKAVSHRNVFPCYFGSALKLAGVRELLSGISSYAAMTEYSEDFGARVYKITTENNLRLTHMKITGGSLKVRSEINGEKVTALRIYSGAKFTSPDTVCAGSLVAAAGLTNTYAGQGIGAETDCTSPLLTPVLSYRLVLTPGTDVHTMYKNMLILEEEDPTLHVSFDSRSGDIHVSLMGKIQLEILTAVIKERFGTEVSFDRGNIAYRETIAAPVVGIGHYEPLRHYAEVHLLMEPLPAGSGLVICSDCSEDVLDRNWQRLILSNLHDKTHIGVLTGSPVTDMKITLVTGRAHLKHTEGGDFRQAAYRAVRMGLRSAESVLLEPFYSYTLRIPRECTGRALNDLQQMGAEFSSPENEGENTVIKGSAPVSEMADYHTAVSGYTKGKGQLSCVFKGYYPCHNADEVIEKIAYDPDSDLENTADSVFCAHGAGFGVKWDEVKGYAHLESGISFRNDEPKEERTVSRT